MNCKRLAMNFSFDRGNCGFHKNAVVKLPKIAQYFLISCTTWRYYQLYLLRQ